MEMTIKGKDRNITFGIGFVRKLDKQYAIKQDGVEFGAGLQLAFPQFLSGSPTVLSDIIRAGVETSVSQNDVDKAIEDYGEEHGEIDSLFDTVETELGKSSITKRAMREAQETMNEAEPNDD